MMQHQYQQKQHSEGPSQSPTNSTFSSASASISSFGSSNSNNPNEPQQARPRLVQLVQQNRTSLVADDNNASNNTSFNLALNNSYEYLSTMSFESDSLEAEASKSDNEEEEDDEEDDLSSARDRLRDLSDRIRVEVEKLAAKSFVGKTLDDCFTANLFDVFHRVNFKSENFRQIQSELVQSNVLRSGQHFLALAKLGHECFKLGLLSTSECLLELAVNRVDTSSQRLKMATLSTLSACYWRQSKYMNAIDCMHRELELAVELGRMATANDDDHDHDDDKKNTTNNPYAYNRYRIFGNLASAHQRLRNFEQCIANLKSQLGLAMDELNEPNLAINALNSIAVLYQRLGDSDKSHDCLLKSLELIEKARGGGGGREGGEKSSNNDDGEIKRLGEVELKQLNLLGDFLLRQGDLDSAREYFMRQLWLSAELKSYLCESSALLNLGFIATRLKSNETSSSYYERCLLSLNTNFDLDALANDDQDDLEYSVIEIYAKCFIGLVNSYLALKDTLNATLYAHSMLDFTLKQMQKLNNNNNNKNRRKRAAKLERYLKYMEINACSKLAVCYVRQSRIQDALKLHEREVQLARELNNILYLTRAYSHLAHIFHSSKNYAEAIDYYKLILAKIESSLLTVKSSTLTNSRQFEGQQQHKIRDERLIEMIFFTLANIGCCLEAMCKYDEARIMFEEQLEMARLMPCAGLKNARSRASALLNLVNLSLAENASLVLLKPEKRMEYLKSLLAVYEEELADLSGQLFATQCLAYCCHREGDLSQASEYYLKNIEIATKLGQKESLLRSLFNASLCYRGMRDFHTAFKFQSDYYSLVQKDPASSVFCKFVSLGLIAELSFEMDNSFANCQRCLEIHLDRLNLVKSLDDEQDGDNSSKEIGSKKPQLIYDCLEAISKLYAHMHDFEQVEKFKRLQLDMLNNNGLNDNTSNTTAKKSVRHRKCKLWLELGKLHLDRANSGESMRYFEMVLRQALADKDLLLESLAVGSLGLCEQKRGNYASAIEHFKRQKTVLQQKLAQIEHTAATDDEKKRHREMISIRIDLARANAKLGRCSQSLGNSPQAEAYFRDYTHECERLHNEYARLESAKKDASNDGQLKEQVYVDYDTSLAELGDFYSESERFDHAIDLNETRLKLIDQAAAINSPKSREIKLHALFNLARLFAKKQKFQKSLNWEKSVEFCERLLELLDESSESNNQELLVEALLLRFDLVYESNPTLAVSSSTRALLTATRVLPRFELKSLRLRHAALSRHVFALRAQGRLKECLEALMTCASHLVGEFQEFEEEESSSSGKPNNKRLVNNGDLVAAKYIECLFLVHRRIALIHMEHSRRDPRAHLLSLKHANEALVYLNHQRQLTSQSSSRLNLNSSNDPKLVEFRLASVYYLLGMCHRSLGNGEMELEMFACSLDFYENLVQLNLDRERDTLIRDKLIEDDGSSFGTVNYEEDEETVVKYSERVYRLYHLIVDALIRMQKLKEALLVVERLRSKLYAGSLGRLAEFLSFDQIEKLIDDERFDAIFYFHFNEINSSLNCWLLKPSRALVRFEKLERFDLAMFTKDDVNSDLEKLYDVLFRPFVSELNLTSTTTTRSMIWIVYDERMFKIPFHLMRLGDSSRLYERYDVNCVHSLKYLVKSTHANQIYTRRRITESGATFLPMKCVSSEEEMRKLLDRSGSSQQSKHSEKFDLLLLLVNPENRDVKLLNGLVNRLLSAKITKSVLVEFTRVVDHRLNKQTLVEFEKKANAFLRLLYSSMVNRTTLNSNLIFSTLANDYEGEEVRERFLGNFLLFGCLGLNVLKKLVVTSADEITTRTPTTIVDQHKKLTTESCRNEEEESLDDVLFELTVVSNDGSSGEVTFSQVIKQYLTLSTRIDNLTQVLALTVGILQDYLNGEFGSEQQVSLKEMFECRVDDVKSQYKSVSATRLMLKRLGFDYSIDNSGKCMVKLPHVRLEKKLTLILRCLTTFESFSPSLVRELFEMSRKTHGKELFVLMKQQQPKTSLIGREKKTMLVIKETTFKLNESFLKEFARLRNFSKSEQKVELEADSQVYDNLVLIGSILLNDFVVKEAEQSLENYVEVFFKEVDNNRGPQALEKETPSNDDEEASLKLSSILKIQPSNQPKVLKINVDNSRKPEFTEIKIHKEVKPKSVKFKDLCENEMMKNKATTENNSRIYNNQIYELVETLFDDEKRNEENNAKTITLNDNNSLIRFEEKEYMNQVVTTTTTTTTKKTVRRSANNTNEELFKLFDNVIYDVYNFNCQSSSPKTKNSSTRSTNESLSNNRSSKSIITNLDKLFVPIHIEKRLN